MYFDVCKDLTLVYEEELASAESGEYTGFLQYLIHRDDWRQGKVIFSDSNNSGANFYLYDTYPASPTIGNFEVYMDYEVELSAVTGQTTYAGSLSNKGVFIPPTLLSMTYPVYPIPTTGVRNWTISDGNQIIYFAYDYEGNTVDSYLGLTTYPIYNGYGDDDDGSWMTDLITDDYEIHFQQNTTGAVVLSACPYKILTIDKRTKEYAGDFSDIVTSGTVELKYKYRPLYQPERARFQYSMEFDGTTERLQSEPTVQALDLTNRWTIATWVKPISNDGNEQQVYCHGNDSNPSRIHLYRDTQDASFPWVIDILDSTSANQKTYYFGPDLSLDEWYFIAAKYASGALTVFVNGAEVTPTDTTQDDAVTQTDTNRYMAVGGKNHVSASDGFDGRIFWAASWSLNISETTLLWLYQNPQHDLREIGGIGTPYSSSQVSRLQHWYRPGKTISPNLGKDYGLSTFDLDDEKDVDDSNLVHDYPRM